MKLSTTEYLDGEDNVAAFLSENCWKHPEMRCDLAQILAEYNEFAREQGLNQMTRKQLKDTLAERGFEFDKAKWKTNGSGYYRGTGAMSVLGLGLQSDPIAARQAGSKNPVTSAEVVRIGS